MTDEITKQIALIKGEKTIIQKELTIPKERMFTVNEALEKGVWLWKVKGTLFTRTFLGETLIRFSSNMNFSP